MALYGTVPPIFGSWNSKMVFISVLSPSDRPLIVAPQGDAGPALGFAGLPSMSQRRGVPWKSADGSRGRVGVVKRAPNDLHLRFVNFIYLRSTIYI